MRDYLKSNFTFYLFWTCMLLFGSIIAIIIFYKTNPAFISRLFEQRQTLEQTQRSFSDIPNPLLDENMQKKMAISGNNANLSQDGTSSDGITNSNAAAATQDARLGETTNGNSAEDEMNKQVTRQAALTAPIPKSAVYVGDPLFRNTKLSSASSFSRSDGRRYSAGTVVLRGFYPDDFDGDPAHTNNLYSAVDVTLEIGWGRLPSFDDIKSLTSDTTLARSFAVPPLQILSMDIAFIDSVSQKENAEIQIRKYLAKVFANKRVPQHIVLATQQRLASSYLQKGYDSIVLRSNDTTQ